MRSITVAERRARLARRHFLAQPAESVPQAAGDIVGFHATDPTTPYLSVWARLPGFTVADLDADLYQHRALLKHLAMRRTLWLVRTEDLPLIQSGASDRVAGNERRRLVAGVQKAGLTEPVRRPGATARSSVGGAKMPTAVSSSGCSMRLAAAPSRRCSVAPTSSPTG